MIVLPMAGLSSRFFKAGYLVPKYQLELPNGQTMFDWAVTSFESYFESEHFVFILRDVYGTKQFVENRLRELGIKSYDIVVLNEETKGQAETVYLGLKEMTRTNFINDELFIFNIDSRRVSFRKSKVIHHENVMGYLEVFHGEGDHWSFIKLDDQNNVILTTEKKRVSSLCSNGLYYFKSIDLFNQLFEVECQKDLLSLTGGELYIAPLYNQLIAKGLIVDYELIHFSEIEFCGTPAEYYELCAKMKEGNI